MFFDINELSGKNAYKLMASIVLPRPIAWVVTVKENGDLNAAPFSFFNVLSGDPPVVALGIGHRGAVKKDTRLNIERTGEFVVNLVSEPMAEAMNITAIEYAYHVNEIDQAKLQTTSSVKVATPRIVGAPVTLECRLWKEVDIDERRSIFLAHVEGVHVADDAIIDADKCYVDGFKLDLIGRLHGAGWYMRVDKGFQMSRLANPE